VVGESEDVDAEAIRAERCAFERAPTAFARYGGDPREVRTGGRARPRGTPVAAGALPLALQIVRVIRRSETRLIQRRPMRASLAAGSFACLLAACANVAPDVGVAEEAVRTMPAVTGFGTNPGQLAMYEYVPDSVPAGPRPLVVALHGCAMTPGSYGDAGWNEIADEHGFYVVYPDQNTSTNNSQDCFNWGGGWDGMPNALAGTGSALHPDDILRGGPEIESIVQMVRHTQDRYEIDERRIYVTGLSAGGGMTAVMLATYPDLFAGGAIIAGIPYGCATDRATVGEARACAEARFSGTSAYLDRSPEAWAELVRNGYSGYTGTYPRVSIWHGASDFIVGPTSLRESMEQWTGVHGIDQTPDETETVGRATRNVYHDGSGRPIVETWLISSMGHGAPNDPPSCGTAGGFTLDVDLCSARLAAEFLGLFDEVGPGVDAGPTTRPDSGTPTSEDDAGTEPTDEDGGTTTRRDSGRPMPGADGGPSDDRDAAMPPGTCTTGEEGPPSPVLSCTVTSPSSRRDGGALALGALIAAALLAARRRRR
jgi:poly(hydroxyalkanoate) depolymerase family esterase